MLFTIFPHTNKDVSSFFLHSSFPMYNIILICTGKDIVVRLNSRYFSMLESISPSSTKFHTIIISFLTYSIFFTIFELSDEFPFRLRVQPSSLSMILSFFPTPFIRLFGQSIHEFPSTFIFTFFEFSSIMIPFDINESAWSIWFLLVHETLV